MNLTLVLQGIHKMSDQWKRCRSLGINSSEHLVRGDPAKINSKQNDRGNQNRLPVLKERLYRVKKRHPVSLNYFYWPKLQRSAKARCQVSLYIRRRGYIIVAQFPLRVYTVPSTKHESFERHGEFETVMQTRDAIEGTHNF